MNSIQNALTIGLLAIVIVFVGFFLYHQTLTYSFQFDDFSFIVDNTGIRDIKDLNAVWNVMQPPSRFVGFMTFALNYHFHQLDPSGYHLVNTLIHIFNALLVFIFAWQIISLPQFEGGFLKQNQMLISFFTAIIFVVHPVQTQAVTYISQRFASLATFFYLVAVCSFLQARMYSNGCVRIFFYGLMLAATFLGLFTKEIFITLPVMLILIELFLLRRDYYNSRSPALFLFIFFAIISLLVIPFLFNFNMKSVVFSPRISESHHGEVITWPKYILTQFRVLSTFTRLLVVPINQNLDYDFPLSQSLLEWKTLGCLLWLMSLLGAAFLLRRKYPIMSFGVFWFFIVLSVNFIPRPHVIFEHKLYLASVGFCLVLIGFLFRCFKGKTLTILIVLLISYIFGVMTLERNRVWKDEISLWSDVIRKSPNKFYPNLNLSKALSAEGEYLEALKYINKAIEIKPDSDVAFNNRGNLYQQLKKYDQALKDYDRSIVLNQNYHKPYYNRGNTLVKMNRYEQAAHDFNTCLALNPDFFKVYLRRGKAYEGLEMFDLALKDYQSYLDLNSEDADVYLQRGNVFRKQNKYNQAIQEYLIVLDIDPHYGEAFANIALIHELEGDYANALEFYAKAVEFIPSDPKIYAHRGDIYRYQGKVMMALNEYAEALNLKSDYVDVYINRALLHKSEGRLKLALENLNAAIVISPSPELFNYRGLLFKSMGQFKIALRDYEHALELNPRYVSAYGNKGIIHYQKRQYDLAIADFDTIIQIKPDFAMAYYMRSLIYNQKGQTQVALSDAVTAKNLGYNVSYDYIQMLKGSPRDKIKRSSNTITADIIMPREQVEKMMK
ncbi:MAG: tetratricopeptide repeat protein [Candidatus Omnitrophica bacterium]|nr:tetratricopeptide repeat protein [Candidatus Omnitrophota bacterium]